MRPPLVVIGSVIGIAVGIALVVGVIRPAWYLRLRYPIAYPKTIVTHAHNYDLPAPLVAAVIEQESSFDARATSSAGARGLMQLTPDTARGIAQHTGGSAFRTSDLLDPEINIRYGCWYLNHLHDRFDTGGSYDLTLAAYNAGQGNVTKWVARDRDHHLTISEIPYAETRAYVRHVNQLARDYARAYPELTP